MPEQAPHIKDAMLYFKTRKLGVKCNFF